MMRHKHHELLRLSVLVLAIGAAARATAQEEQTQNQNPQGLDFYRIAGNITTGVMISKQNPFGAGEAVAIGQDFSKANLYLGLNLTRSWVMKERWQLNNLFDARLTAIPVQTAVTPTAVNGNGNGNGNGDANGNGVLRSDPNSFLLSSRKAAQMQLGIYVPILSPREREAQVENGPNDQPRKFANGDTAYYKRAFYIAPIGKLGIQTLTEGQQSGEMVRFGQDDVYNYWAIGGRIGVLRRFYRGTSSTSPQLDKDRGAESLLHLDFMRGRFENFTIPTTFVREANDPPELRVGNRLWRYAFEGRLRLPYIPYTFLGFDANLGKGRDDVRFIFGINIELGPLVSTLNQ